MRKQLGQAVSEYTSIAILLALVSIPAWAMLGQNLNGTLAGMISMKPAAKATPAPAPAPAPAQASTPDPVVMPNSGQIKQATYKTANGTPVTITPLDTPLSTAVMTAGVNGTTSVLADNIQVIAAQLLAANELTEAQYNSLITLANEGHRLGTMMGLMEEAAANARTNDEFDATIVTFEGKRIAIEELENGLGYAATSTEELPKNPLSTSDRPYKDTARFIAAYQSALKSGAMDDPQTQQIVESLASQIAYLVASIDNTQASASTNEIKLSAFMDNTSDLLVHVDSAGICTAGNGNDSGIQCSQ
jgi:hypothetical protein